MIEKCDGNRQIEITGVEHIKLELSEMMWGGVDWIYLAQDRD
jgi:hypothetical protein